MGIVVQKFPIISDLATFRSENVYPAYGTIVALQGTTSPNDAGQCLYQVDLTDKTTADNGTTCIVDLGGYRFFRFTLPPASGGVLPISEGGTGATTAVGALDDLFIQGANISSAAPDLSTATGQFVNITGTTTITALGTLTAGNIRFVKFAGILTLTYNATSLILPGQANITTAAGDTAIFLSLGSGNWQCLVYTQVAGGSPGVLPISEGGTGKTTSVAAFDALAAQGANITAAATTDIGAATGPIINVTGNTTITSFGTKTAGTIRWVKFTGTPLLTYDGTALILPGAANIQAAANDAGMFVSLGSGNWICVFYQPANGQPIVTVSIAKGGTGQVTSVAGFDALGAQGADIVAASTTDLSAATGPYVNITGNTTITALGTAAAGTKRSVKFTGTPLLTYNATSLILPSTANIQAAANDAAEFVSLGSGNWICTSYTKANGQAVVSPSSGFTQVVIQKFSGSGTYTPTASMKYCVIECWGGGGAGGGAVSNASQSAGGGGGGAGSYSRAAKSAAQIGVSQTVTIGAGGTAGSAGANPGNAGGDTSVGSLCVGKGGSGGSGASTGSGGAPGAGGIAGTGDVTSVGPGGIVGGGSTVAGIAATSGQGGSTAIGSGGLGYQAAATGAGAAGTGFASGGAGGTSYNAGGSVAGGAGAGGYVIVTEYI